VSGNAGTDADPEAARLAVRLEEARFEVELAQEARRRLEAETHRLETRLAALDSERESLRSRLDERERYIDGIHTSAGWRLIQAVRGWFGRRW
jgi:predicted nuclease with TOPRIM domain